MKTSNCQEDSSLPVSWDFLYYGSSMSSVSGRKALSLTYRRSSENVSAPPIVFACTYPVTDVLFSLFGCLFWAVIIIVWLILFQINWREWSSLLVVIFQEDVW